MHKTYTAIIILVYNNCKDTINCINSIEKYNTAPIKIVIVNNGSSNVDTVQELGIYLSETYKNKYEYRKENGLYDCKLSYVTLLDSKKNDGYAQGNNKGLQLIYEDNEIENVLILNNDVLWVEDIIPELQNILDTIPDVGIVSPILYKKNLIGIDYNCARKDTTIWNEINNNLFHYIYRILSIDKNKGRYLLNDYLSPNCLLPIELPSGSCMMIKKNLLKEIGSFDPNTFLYYEENILYQKMKKNGKQNYLTPKVKCIHLGAASTKEIPSLFIVKCAIDSGKYYMKNYYKCSQVMYSLYVFSTIFYKYSLILQKKLQNKGI